MRIVRWSEPDPTLGNTGQMVRVNKLEALKLISGLISQIVNNDPNNGRAEFATENDGYFSISVQPNSLCDEQVLFKQINLLIRAARDTEKPESDSSPFDLHVAIEELVQTATNMRPNFQEVEQIINNANEHAAI